MDLAARLLAEPPVGQHHVDAPVDGIGGAVGVAHHLLELGRHIDRGRRSGRDQHQTLQPGGTAGGQYLGDLAAHGVAHRDVLVVPELVDDVLGVVGEPLHAVRTRHRGRLTPAAVAV